MRALYYFWIAVGSTLILQFYSFTVLLILANCFAVPAEYAQQTLASSINLGIVHGTDVHHVSL